MIVFLTRSASEIQPTEVKWRLMVASCHRRMLAYTRALELYEEIHTLHPDNMECLRYLVVLCKDLGRRFDGYESKLLRLERQAAQSTVGTGAMTRMEGGYDDRDGGSADQQHNFNQHQYGASQYSGRNSDGNELAGGVDDSSGVADHTYGSSADRFAAPSVGGHVSSPSGGRAAREDETFADADLSDLLV